MTDDPLRQLARARRRQRRGAPPEQPEPASPPRLPLVTQGGRGVIPSPTLDVGEAFRRAVQQARGKPRWTPLD